MLGEIRNPMSLRMVDGEPVKYLSFEIIGRSRPNEDLIAPQFMVRAGGSSLKDRSIGV